MKRVMTALLALLLVPALCGAAPAAGSAEIVRAFCSGGALYTYVDLSGVDRPVTRAEAQLEGQTFPASGRLETVRQAGSPVSYLLLVDVSTSMPGFQGEILDFAQALVEGSGENARFALAAFGDGFQMVSEDAAPEELEGLLSGLTYTQPITQLHSAIGAALDWFESVPRSGSELRSLVLLTDAVEYDPQGGVPYEELLERVGRSDVMLHAVGFGEDSASLERLGQLVEASDGGAWVVGDGLTGAQAAGELVEHTGRLSVIGFDLSGFASDGAEVPVSLTFSSGAELLCRAEAQVAVPAMEAEETPATPAPSLPPAQQPEGGGTAGAPSSPSQPEKGGPPLPLMAAIGAAVLLLLLIPLVLRRKKAPPAPAQPQAPAQAPPPPPPPACGIYLRAEVLRGTPRDGRTELQLTEELLVGRDPSCALSFDDEALAERHCRLFVDGGAVCLQDLGAPGGTRVNGELLTSPRRLRSGDEICAGETAFRLKF